MCCAEGLGMALIIFISIFVMAASLVLMQKSVRVFNIKHLTIAGFFYILYLARIYIPSFIVYANHPGDYRDTFMFAVQTVLITFPLGLLFANFLAKFKLQEIKRFFSKPIESTISLHFGVVFWLLLGCGIGLMLFNIYQMDTIPILYMISHPGAEHEISVFRELGGKLLLPWGPLRYLYAWSQGLIFPLLTMIALGAYLVSERRRLFWGTSFAIALILAIFYASLTTAKAPVAFVFLLLLIFYYLFKSGEVSKKKLFGFVVLMLAFPLFVTMMKYGRGLEDLWRVWSGIFRRLFYVPSDVLYYYFEVFPAEVDFLYGRSISFVSLWGQEHFNIANYVYLHIFPTSAIASGHSNACFVGNLYADFGMAGVLVGSFLTGTLVQAIQIFLLRRGKTVLSLAVYAFLIFAFYLLTATSVTSTLLTGGVIVVFIIAFGIKLMERILSDAVS